MAEGDDEKIGGGAPTDPAEMTAGEELRLTILEVVAACPDFIAYGGDPKKPEAAPVGKITMEAIKRASKRVSDLRARIEEAQTISQETAVRYLEIAAAAYLLSQQELSSDERRMYDAGIRVGEYISRRWQARIGRELAKQKTGN